MPLLLLNNWKLILAASALLLAFGTGWHLGAAHGRAVGEARQKALCIKSQAVTQEVSHDYQNNLAGVYARYDAALERLRSNRLPAPGPAGGRDAPPSTDRLPRDNRAALLALALAADKQTRQLIACQAFVSKVRELNR